jgi:hypothetical protein
MMVAIFFEPQELSHLGILKTKKRLPHIFSTHSLRNLWHNLNAAQFWSAQRSRIGVPSLFLVLVLKIN